MVVTSVNRSPGPAWADWSGIKTSAAELVSWFLYVLAAHPRTHSFCLSAFSGLHPQPHPHDPIPVLSATKTAREASVSAAFLALPEVPPHNQTGATLVFPSQISQTNTEKCNGVWKPCDGGKYSSWLVWILPKHFYFRNESLFS